MKILQLGFFLAGFGLLFAGCTTSQNPASPSSDVAGVPRKALIKLPKPLETPPPVYPPDLKKSGITGEALIGFVVTPDGRVTRIQIISASNLEFGRAAADAVSKWTFEPGEKDGKAVNSSMTVPISFSLQD